MSKAACFFFQSAWVLRVTSVFKLSLWEHKQNFLNTLTGVCIFLPILLFMALDGNCFTKWLLLCWSMDMLCHVYERNACLIISGLTVLVAFYMSAATVKYTDFYFILVMYLRNMLYLQNIYKDSCILIYLSHTVSRYLLFIIILGKKNILLIS